MGELSASLSQPRSQQIIPFLYLMCSTFLDSFFHWWFMSVQECDSMMLNIKSLQLREPLNSVQGGDKFTRRNISLDFGSTVFFSGHQMNTWNQCAYTLIHQLVTRWFSHLRLHLPAHLLLLISLTPPALGGAGHTVCATHSSVLPATGTVLLEMFAL